MSDMKVVADPGTQEIVITRSFDAPRELVFKAFTDPDAVRQWWGLNSTETVVDRLEARPGGQWRFVEREGDGNEYGFHGVFHGTPSVDGIVQTFEYEGTPGHVCLETLTFEERGDTTLVRTASVYQSVADRDAMIESGMEQGLNEGYDRLDELIARLAAVR